MKRECVYENGVRKEVIEELVEGGEMRLDNEERRKCRRVDESKRLCFDCLSNEFNEDSLVLYDMELECNYGVWKTSEKCYMIKQSLYENRVIEADLKSHCMRVYDDNELREDSIDLNGDEKRWKGGVENEKPFGYGVLYSEEGKKEYEGFMMDGKKCLYGVEYDDEKVKYEGCFFYGNRFGKGVSYDGNGEIEYEGLWKDDKQFSYKSTPKISNKDGYDKSVNRLVKRLKALFEGDMRLGSDEWTQKHMEYENHKEGSGISNYTQSFTIPTGVLYCVDSFLLSQWLQSLKKFVIRDISFERVQFVEIDGLGELQSVEIGERCFVDEDTDEDDDDWEGNRFCRIVNCPKLKSIKIGKESFRDYHSFELKKLASLKSVSVGQFCFKNTKSVIVAGLVEC